MKKTLLTISLALALILPVLAQNKTFFGLLSGNGQPALYWESPTNVTGSPASAWQSVIGSISLSQGTGANQPAVTAAAFGSLQGLTFDGSNDVLTNASRVVSRTGAATLSIVFKTGSTVTGPFVLVSESDSAATDEWWEFGIASDGKLYVESNDAGTKMTVKGSTVLDVSTKYNAILTYDGTDYYLSLNGVEENPLVIENAGAFAWMGQVGGTQVFSVGATVISGSTVRYCNCVVGGVYLWNRDITSN